MEAGAELGFLGTVLLPTGKDPPELCQGVDVSSLHGSELVTPVLPVTVPLVPTGCSVSLHQTFPMWWL